MKPVQLTCRLLALCLGTCGLMPAALLQYEGFDYTAGSSINGQNGGSGWSGAWGTPGGLDATVAGATLNFGGLPVSGGALATAGSQPPGQGSSVATWVRSTNAAIGANGTTTYFSFLLRPDTGFGFYGGLNLGPAFVGLSGNQAFYGLEGPGNDVSLSSVGVSAGQAVFFVLRVDFQAGNDTLSLFLNPVPGQPEPGVASVVKTNLDLGTFSSLTVNNYGGFMTDEIRIGTDFASVAPTAVPEPAVGAAVGVLMMVLVGVRRR